MSEASVLEIPSRVAGWDDEEGEWDETLFYHFMNIGWTVEEELKKNLEDKTIDA